MTSTTGSLHEWATQVRPTPIVVGASPAQPQTSRRGTALLAGAMVAFPAAMTLWFAIEPTPLPREAAADFLTPVAEHTARYLVATGFVFLTGLCLLVASVGVTRLLRPRLPTLSVVTGGLLALAGVGAIAQVGVRVVVTALVDADGITASGIEVWQRFQDSALFGAFFLPMLLGVAGGTLLLALGSGIKRVLPWWASACMVGGLVVGSGEFGAAANVAGAVVSLVGWSAAARALYRSNS